MRRATKQAVAVFAATVFAFVGHVDAQIEITGRVLIPACPNAQEMFPMTAAVTFATPTGTGYRSSGSRTWETHPSGWFTMANTAGCYTVTFAAPGKYMRPMILTNQYLDHGERVSRTYTPRADYAVFKPEAWDEDPATDYYQTFEAVSTSITQVGFKLASDGVDGQGPLTQTLYVSVHRVTDASPEDWPQIGPTMPVLNVNAGGVLDIEFAACFNSGEVPVTPGKHYAIHLSAGPDGQPFQCFWAKDCYPKGECYRIGKGKDGSTGRDQWLYVCGDQDELLIPYNKRVQMQYTELTQFTRKWSQTYVAQGKALASVILYAAIASDQPMLPWQRAYVRVRKGGPAGPVVGVEKIAIGQSTATGHSGVFGVSFAPGEVELESGQTYAIEFESFGQHKGFNPWRKHELDPYPGGQAYANGNEPQDYDLDMIIVEYAHAAKHWDKAVHPRNLLANGDMEKGALDSESDDAGKADAWSRFAVDPQTSFWYRKTADGNRYLSVVGGSVNDQTVDGGYVQRVSDLTNWETYRLSGRVRCSWPVDLHHKVRIGLDATGQLEDPQASTINWVILPRAEGVFETFQSDPCRPVESSISVWLRGTTDSTAGHPFEAAFDEFALQRVKTTAPDGQ